MKEKTQRKSNSGWLKWFLFAVVVLDILLFALVVFYFPLEVREFPVTLEVAESMGFDLNGSALSFGKVYRGSSAVRNVEIENWRDYPVKVYFTSEGDAASFLDFENELAVNPGEKLSVPFSARIPSNYPLGNYSGKVTVRVYKYR